MLRNKLLSITLSSVILGSVFNPINSLAKEKSLTYDQVIQELETTKLELESTNNLSQQKKEKISEEYANLVGDFLASNQELSQEKVSKIVNSLNEFDVLLYDVEKEKGNANFGSKSINYKKADKDSSSNNEASFAAASTLWNGKGDILLSMDAKTWNIPHGHAAILSTAKDYVIEALPRPGVIMHSASKYWSTVSDDVQYYVKGAPDSAYTTAANYATAQVGEPYTLETTLYDTSKWYCSKLVFKAWQSVGYDLGSVSFGAVLPNAIAADVDTIAYKWNPY
jgi:uncharacterized protein YycO